MIQELLKPQDFMTSIENRIIELEKTLKVVRKNQGEVPSGHLRISQKKTHVEFYYITKTGSSRGKYISVKEKAFASQLAQKEYDRQIIDFVKKEINLLKNCLHQTENFSEIENYYRGLCLSRQQLITPVTLTDEQYREQWQKITWERKPIAEDAVKYFTANEECVRSKSEVIIADSLLRHGVPYRYEYPLKLKAGRGICDRSSELTFYPDFLCLNLRTRKEFIWEHFGIMDNEEYSSNAVGKLNLYSENGILPGRNLIITMEAQNEPLNTKAVDKLIKEFLL